jgi:hypothetical protein
MPSDGPCSIYSKDSTGISQECYNKIWNDQGCTGPTQDVINSEYLKALTIDGLVNDSYLWATMKDYVHRTGCYGNAGNPYYILGVGTDGNLYSRPGLDAPWSDVKDDSNGSLVSLFTGSDGKLYATNKDRLIIYKNNWSDATWSGTLSESGTVMSAAMAPDTTIVGVGMNNKLWSRPLNGTWVQTANDYEWCSYVTIAPNGKIFVIGQDTNIYSKNSYKDLTSQTWENQGGSPRAITIAPDGTFIGVGQDLQLYSKPDYNNLSSNWMGPYNNYYNSCCVMSITTIANPNYNPSNYTNTPPVYPNLKMPVYPDINTNTTQFTALKGRTWWGTSGISEGSAESIEECQNRCASDINCSGATFNDVKKYCWLRTGESNITPGIIESDYAIITKKKEASINLKTINDRLIQLNDEIVEQFKSITKTEEMDNTYLLLTNQYKKLSEEKILIDKQIQEYFSVEETLVNQELYVSQQNITMRFWMIIVCLILLFTLKKLYGDGSLPIEFTFWIFVILLLLVLSFTLRTPTGFFIFFIVVFYILVLR